MAFLRRPIGLFLLVAIAAFVTLAVTPAIAFGDTLSWSSTYAGPNDFYNYPNDPIPVAGAFDAVSFADATHGWATGRWVKNAAPQTAGTSNGFVAFTSNGGSTWTSATVGTKELHAVTAITAANVWAVGSSGTVAHWNGFSWAVTTVPGWSATYALRGVAFTDAVNGWAVGDGGGVVRTTDGGATWVIVKTPTSSGTTLRAVTVLDASTCLAVGNSGTMLRLTTSAQSVYSGTSQNLYGVAFSDSAHGWAVGDGPTVMRTSNGGTSWSTAGALPLPVGVSELDRSSRAARAVAFSDAQTGVVVGAYQVVWRTLDGGDTWAVEPIADAGSDGGLELRATAFVPGDPSTLVTVARRDARWALDSSDFKARAYRGTWTGRVLPAPTPPASVTLSNPGTPGPRLSVTWTASSVSRDGYEIERAKGSAAGPWTAVQTVGAAATTWIDTSVNWTDTYFYRVRSFRGALLSGWTTSAGLRVDMTAPVTTSNAKLVFPGSAHITLSAADDGSGVATTQWEVDGSGGTGTTVDTSLPGDHVLKFRSVDVAGNTEVWREVTFYVSDTSVVDTTPPVTTRVGSGWSYYAAPATVSFVATDTGAGVYATLCRINGASPLETTTVSLTDVGTYTLEFWSVDLGGNVEATHTITFTVLARPSSAGTPSKPVVASTVTHSRYFTTYGYVKYHRAGTYPVTLLFYRYKSGKYVYYKSTRTVVSTIRVPGTDFSMYKARKCSVPYKGKWRVRAKHVVSGRSRYSSYSYFTAN